MYYCQFTIKDCTTRLTNMASKIKPEAEGEMIDGEKPKIIGVLLDLIKGLEELDLLFGYKQRWARTMISEAVAALDIVFDSTYGKQIKDEIEKVCETVPSNFSYESSPGYLQNSEDRFYTNPNLGVPVMNDILNTVLATPERPFNVLDTRCGNGTNARTIKGKYSQAHVYGVEVNENNAACAKSYCDKVARGGIYGSKISNDAFDMLFVVPELDMSYQGELAFKKEKDAVQNSARFLRPGGLLVLVIPYFRLYKDVCHQISRYYSDIHIYKTYTEDFAVGGRIVITGTKRPAPELDAEAYNFLRTYRDPYSIDAIHRVEPLAYKMTGTMLEIALFRGKNLDHEEMLGMIQGSGLTADFLNKQEKGSNTKMNRPLLPFNIGQIGLVLTSGCLDGVVDEGSSFHAIKGRVAKKVIEERRIENNRATVIKTSTNKVEIDVILADGTYKTLA